MHTGIFNVFTDGICEYLPVVCDGVHLDFLGVFDEAADNDGVLAGDFRCQTQKAVEFLVVGAYVHRRSAQHI